MTRCTVSIAWTKREYAKLAARNEDQGGFAMRAHCAGPKDSGLWLRRAALVACLVGVISTAVRAEPSFPVKPIHIFIPYGAGGVGDLTVRLLAQKLTERTKQQVVIENRPGAGGLLSAKGVLDAPPDGYTLGLFGNGQAISMSLFKSRPYNVLTDFSFVSITARFEMLLAVKANSPLKTLPDVVAAARKSPGKLNFGAVNPGSTQNLSAHLLKQVGELDVTIIPYKTTPDLITAILRGDLRRAAQPAAARRADREGQRVPAIHRDQLERAGCAGRAAGRRAGDTQSRDQR